MSHFYTHMPFLFPHNGNNYMLFSADEGKGWRLHWSLLEPWDPRPIVTGLSAHAQMCAPSAFVENGMIRLSAIVNYRLHQFEGPSLDMMSLVAADERTNYAGTVTPTHILRGSREYIEVANRNDEPQGQIDVTRFGFNDFAKMIRLGFAPSDPDKIVITGNFLNEGFRSYVYSMSMDRAWIIKVAGENIYKCALGDGKVYYTVRMGNDARYIVASSDYDLIPL